MQVTATNDCSLLLLADWCELALWLVDVVTPQELSCSQLNSVIHTNTISKAPVDIHAKNSLDIDCVSAKFIDPESRTRIAALPHKS